MQKRPTTEPELRVISLGAGVQSSVLALMSAKGELPKVDCAIFADTGGEPDAIYSHLEWLTKEIARLPHGFPVYIVNRKEMNAEAGKGNSGYNLRDNVIAGVDKYGFPFREIPVFYRDAKQRGGVGFLRRRQCTQSYKIEPVEHKIRSLCGVKRGQKFPKGKWVEQWLGISFDEIQRASSSLKHWLYIAHPLCDMRLRRLQLQDWFAKHYPDRPLVKSACTFCPFHTNEMWRDLRSNDPKGWAEAVRVDKALRGKNSKELFYLHRSCKPLDEADLGAPSTQQDIFDGTTLAGGCGVGDCGT